MSITSTQPERPALRTGSPHPQASIAAEDGAAHSVKPFVLVGMMLLTGATILAIAVAAAIQGRSPSLPPPPPTLYPAGVLGQAPQFELTERSGAAVSTASLAGHVWVVDFIFTHCAGPCPMMSTRMAALQRAVEDLPEVRLVSISVDPERDTPQKLAEYADRYRADPDKWLFLTGDFDVIKRTAVDGFKLGSLDDPVIHSDRFVLVDASGAIRGYFDSTEPGVIDALDDAIRTVLAETPAP